MQDEALFVYDVIVDRKYWSLVDHSISVPYTSSHEDCGVRFDCPGREAVLPDV